MSQSVFIATAALDGRLWADCATSVAAAQVRLTQAGIPSTWRVLGEICYLPIVRNKLVRGFLETDCTDLVFVDSDVGFPPEALERALGYDVDIVCGATPIKQAREAFPVDPVKNLRPRFDGLQEVKHGPTGFMRIRRDVFAKLLKTGKVPHIVDIGPSGGKRGEYDVYFDTRSEGQSWIGEDVAFCRMAREAGIKVWLDPDITFTHAGPWHWVGNYREHTARAAQAG